MPKWVKIKEKVTGESIQLLEYLCLQIKLDHCWLSEITPINFHKKGFIKLYQSTNQDPLPD
jgi:hypothetical protein